eukprot:3239649-Pleurochrysis_carterae.AAC.2
MLFLVAAAVYARSKRMKASASSVPMRGCSRCSIHLARNFNTDAPRACNKHIYLAFFVTSTHRRNARRATRLKSCEGRPSTIAPTYWETRLKGRNDALMADSYVINMT